MSCFYWLEEGWLAGSCAPRTVADIKSIVEKGIRRVVVLPEDEELAYLWGYPGRYFSKLDEFGLEHIHEPVPDMMPPTPSQLKRILGWIKNGGGPVLVHCVGGLGRTGTVLAAWLIVERGYTLREAVSTIRRLRPGSIESYHQIRFLESLEAREKGMVRRRTP